MLSDLLADTDEEVRDLSVGAGQRTAPARKSGSCRSPARVAREPCLAETQSRGRSKNREKAERRAGQGLEAATISVGGRPICWGLSAVGGTCARECAKPGSEACRYGLWKLARLKQLATAPGE